MRIRAMAVCMGLLVAVPALAQTPAPPEPAVPPAAAPAAPPVTEGDDPRYTFSRVQDGYLRLDTRTGQVALCSRRQVGWACQLLPDDRQALEGEIARLQAESGALKKELLSRGLPLPSGVKPPPPERREEAAKPVDPEINRVLGMIEAVWRRLVEMIAGLQRDMLKKS